MRAAKTAGFVLAGIMLLAACEDPEPTRPPQTAPHEESPAAETSAPADRAADAERFAPLVWLANNEELTPDDADAYLRSATLRWAHDKACGDDEVAATVDARKLATGGYEHQGKGGPPGCEHGGRTYRSDEDTRPRSSEDLGAEGFYLDGDDDARGGSGTGAPVYWQYYKGAYVYWFFYPYNDAPDIPVGPGSIQAFDHEGDWERIAVRTDGHGTAIGVTLWGHGNSCYVREDQLDWADGHPVVFSALGTHASYSGGHFHRGGIDLTSEGTPWETWPRVAPIADQDWYGYGGGWGSVGAPGPEANHRTGPAGPQPDREPSDAWTEHHCTEADQLPTAMVGEWSSPKPADQPDSDKTYYVKMKLTGGSVGSVVGTVSYPGLDCSGTFTLEEVQGGTVTVEENITDDPTGLACTPRGSVGLSVEGDTMGMTYTRESGERSMTAELVRAK